MATSMNDLRYSIAPLCLSASVAELEEWVSSAPQGAEFIYARGAVLDQRRDVVRRAGELREEGEVRTHQRKVRGEWEYFVVRRHPERGSDRRVAPTPVGDDTPAGRVLAILRRCQKLGLPARTNTEIAREMGLKNAEAARYLFNQLVEQKIITVQSMGTRERRVVTFVGTGKSTVRGAL
jgi:hypothetical protein